jgi:hypothetical protein
VTGGCVRAGNSCSAEGARIGWGSDGSIAAEIHPHHHSAGVAVLCGPRLPVRPCPKLLDMGLRIYVRCPPSCRAGEPRACVRTVLAVNVCSPKSAPRSWHELGQESPEKPFWGVRPAARQTADRGSDLTGEHEFILVWHSCVASRINNHINSHQA